MKHAILYRFFNENDIPQFGTGFRTVIALEPGRKWITLVDWTTLDTAKILISQWERLKPQTVQYRLSLVLNTMKERVPYKFEDGKPVAEGAVGEIATRSVANMSGYWNMPDATAKTIDGDGWLRTGDADISASKRLLFSASPS